MWAMQLSPGVIVESLIHAIFQATASFNYIFELLLVVKGVFVFIDTYFLAQKCLRADL